MDTAHSEPWEFLERKIRAWNSLWAFIVVLAILAVLAFGFLTGLKTSMKRLRATVIDGASLGLHSTTDGPYVVTHLVDQRLRVWAALDPPLAIIDSGGRIISKDDISKLKWHNDRDGSDAEAPPLQEIQAWYVEPNVARQHTKEAD